MKPVFVANIPQAKRFMEFLPLSLASSHDERQNI